MIYKFSDLLEKTDLDNIVEFSDKVASKIEDIEFLEKLVYSEISKNVKERKELHKFLERMLWVFGEEYSESTKLLSDKNLEKNLTQLRGDCLIFKPSKDGDNINVIDEKPVKSITDLFMYNERVLDAKRREVLVVELKGAGEWEAAEDERQIGELWANLSEGQCEFIMIKDKRFDLIESLLS